MACFGKKTQQDIEGVRKNKEIDGGLKEDRRASKYKLLLLGTGDAGKSTFCKQMQIIHEGDFKSEEIDRYAEILRDNCLTSMHALLLACKEWGYVFDKKSEPLAEQVLASSDLVDPIADAIIALCETSQLKQALKRSNEIQIPGGESGALYFFESCKRFAAPDFKPTSQDIIRAKMRTTGILEVHFKTPAGQEFTMVDVGGQRSERRKWLHCFGDVTAVIFLVAINEYDMVLEEDNKTNRMEESLKLFSKLTGSQWFDEVSFLLFLNKTDLFREKLKTRPLTDFFEDFDQFAEDFKSSGKLAKDTSGEEEEFVLSSEYFKAQYVKAFNGKRLYSYLTCAIDTSNCEKVWTSVKNSIMTTALNNIGI